MTLHSRPNRDQLVPNLKGHCHGDFAIFSSKWPKYLTKNLFFLHGIGVREPGRKIKGFIRERTNYK